MNKTILVIEDNPDNMALVCEILEDADYLVQEAMRAEDGITRLKQGGIDLVLMDISLPEMDGMEATRLIKADNILKSIPVIGLSAHAMISDKEAALDAGCDDYQTKPIDEGALLTLIDNYLTK
ncbi:MAG: response regulator [Proteobacteria bacterium]|nr:response regulator [Pseudomonadota bacterium]